MKDKFAADMSKIVGALGKHGRLEITGAGLAALIRDTVPDLDVRKAVGAGPGPGALKKFVALHLDEHLTQTSSSGSDVVYSLRGWSKHEAEQVAAFDPEPWRCFVKPHSQHRVLLDLDTDTLSIGTRFAGASANVVVIDNAMTGELNCIRSEFIDAHLKTVEDFDPEHLAVAVPYNRWIAALKALNGQVAKQWAEYRMLKVRELFNSRLVRPEVEEKLRRRFEEQFEASRRAAYASKPAKSDVRESEPTQEQRPSFGQDVRQAPWYAAAPMDPFREIVVRALLGMTNDELRQLNLPVGVMIDALAALSTER